MDRKQISHMVKESLSGVVSIQELTIKAAYYKCPCGGTDHYASRSQDLDTEDKLSAIITCFETNKQWFISPLSHTALIISQEEAKYFALLREAPKKIKPFIEKYGVTGKSLAILHHTYGYDPSVVESVVGNIPQKIHDAYQEEIEKHKQTGKSHKKPNATLST